MSRATLGAGAAALLAAVALGGCRKQAPVLAYQVVPVERRDIIVSAQAAGPIQPDTLVEVKSKASGEILQILAETGELVKQGQPLIKIDPRTARNAVATAQAQLDVAKATLANASTQQSRSAELYKSQSITQQELETAQLAYANAKAQVVQAQVALDNAKIAYEDVVVKAPITGTIIEKDVERGQVIASAISNVSGGTVLMRMADLSLVQVRASVDETDIGKIQPGMSATVTVDAYPNQPFQGTVIKIEPLADTIQNVTRFPVRVRIQNRQGLLRPGMNTEVEIHVGQRDSVLAVPNAALRTQRDVGSAAQVLGIAIDQVQKDLAAAKQQAPPNGDTATDGRRASLGANPPGAAGAPAGASAAGDGGAGRAAPAKGDSVKPGNVMTTPDGRTIPLPSGITEQQVRAIFQKRFGGGELTAQEQAIMQQVRQAMGRAGGGARRSGNGFQYGGSYIVFAKRNGPIHAVPVATGLTDLDYSEIRSGLTAGDSVVLLPSASLVQSQQDFKQRFNNLTGGGLPGVRQQGGSSTSAGGAGGGAGGARPGGGGGR
jgi:HlyD family secretion protein